jgi:hypothetical protein
MHHYFHTASSPRSLPTRPASPEVSVNGGTGLHERGRGRGEVEGDETTTAEDEEAGVHDPDGDKNTTLPLFSTVVYNARSMSAHTSNSTRFHAHIRNIRALALNHDIIHVLETKFSSTENFILNTLFPNHNIYYNNLNRSTAGTATLVRSKLESDFVVSHHIVTQGYTAYIHLQPHAASAYTAAARYFSIYLLTGSNAASRAASASTTAQHNDNTHSQTKENTQPDDGQSRHTDDTTDDDTNSNSYSHSQLHDYNNNTDDNTQDDHTPHTDRPPHPPPPLRADHWPIRTQQIQQLANLPRQKFEIFSGDWNFVTEAEDTIHDEITPYYRLPTAFSSAWDKLLQSHQLHEIAQPHHTRYSFNHSDGTLLSSSRLDRHYVNLSDAHMEIVTPKTDIHFVPEGVLDNIRSHRKLLRTKTIVNTSALSLTDHLPVSLQFHAVRPAGRGYRVPEWVVSHRTFVAKVKDSYVPHIDPHTNLSNLNRAIIETSKSITARCRSRNLKPLEVLTLATKLLRLAASSNPKTQEITRLVKQHPGLKKFITPQGKPNIPKIEESINDLLTEDHQKKNLPNEPGAQAAFIYKNFIKSASASLPSNKNRFCSLRPTPHQESTTDPRKMTKIATRFWRKIWDRDTEGPSGLAEYINIYGKTIDTPPPPPTLASVVYQIKNSKDTSPGPNGIPFSAYRILLTAGGATNPGPILYKVLQ